jgi:hypothetical protein
MTYFEDVVYTCVLRAYFHNTARSLIGEQSIFSTLLVHSVTPQQTQLICRFPKTHNLISFSAPEMEVIRRRIVARLCSGYPVK